MNWHLDNILNRKKESPYTFYAPSDLILNKLKVGDIVKLIFVINEPTDEGPSAERMWVIITEREGNSFKGTLDNEPTAIEGLHYQDVISFETQHISNTEHDDPTSYVQEMYMDTFALVTNDVCEKDEYNVMVKDNPHDKDDCGWMFYSGYESDEYLDDTENYQVVALGVLLNMDDSCLAFLDQASVGSVYERNDNGVMRKVDEIEMESSAEDTNRLDIMNQPDNTRNFK